MGTSRPELLRVGLTLMRGCATQQRRAGDEFEVKGGDVKTETELTREVVVIVLQHVWVD